VATQRILVNQPWTLKATFYVDEDPVADSPVAVTITRADGTAVVTAAATTVVGGTYSYTLAGQAAPQRLTATWTGASGKQVKTYVDLAGAFFFELADLRAVDGLAGNSTLYPTAALRAARDRVETFFEDVTAEAWVPRFARETHTGDGGSLIVLDQVSGRSVVSVSLDGVAATDLTIFKLLPEGLERTTGAFTSPSGGADGNVIVEYLYGADEPPADLWGAAMRLARHMVLGSNSRIDERTMAMTTDFGTFQLGTASSKRPSGLPEVDAVLSRYSDRVAGFA
jgi:hypothetical protein